MAATKYQVLYRYVNETTNTPITNSMDNEYEAVCEFYTDPHHKIFFSSDPTAQAEATDEQQQLISFGNSSENPKNNMLFAYDGTKKIKHPKWVPEQTGYEVRDWKQLKRSSIGNQGDFTKEFTTIEALTPEDGGVVICTEKVLNKYFPRDITVVADNSKADRGTQSNPYYSKEQIEQLIVNSTLFALESTDYTGYTKASSQRSYLINSYTSATCYYGPVAIEQNNMRNISTYGGGTVFGSTTSENLYSKVVVSKSHIKRVQVPGHYEESLETPYLIKDTYKRIQLSPWFVNCTCGSLESAVNKARVLVDMLGIENVKLIKVVPFDQFIKIK